MNDIRLLETMQVKIQYSNIFKILKERKSTKISRILYLVKTYLKMKVRSGTYGMIK